IDEHVLGVLRPAQPPRSNRHVPERLAVASPPFPVLVDKLLPKRVGLALSAGAIKQERQFADHITAGGATEGKGRAEMLFGCVVLAASAQAPSGLQVQGG